MFNLDLDDENNHFLLAAFPDDQLENLKLKLHKLGVKNHFLLSSSGTNGGDWKGYLISKESLLINAKAVNERLGLSENDIWGASLPSYHIGGLSIYFRAKLLNHTPIDLRPWNPHALTGIIREHNVSVISLVPAQVYDLVKFNISAPQCLRIVLVGGDFLGQVLSQRFQDLGWPMVQTFGMSEVSSQLCTGMNENGFYSPLPIHEIKTDEFHQLLVKSRSFFSYLVRKKEEWELIPLKTFLDADGFFRLPDRGLFHRGELKVLGRDDGLIKSSGHLLNYLDLKDALDRFCLEHNCWGKMELQTSDSEREGQQLTLHYLESLPEQTMLKFLEEIQPVKIKDLKRHVVFERTDLGKFKRLQT